MGGFGVLGWGLFGVGIDRCWNFNGCKGFCGGDFGEWVCVGGAVGKWLKGLVLVGLVVVGRG